MILMSRLRHDVQRVPAASHSRSRFPFEAEVLRLRVLYPPPPLPSPHRQRCGPFKGDEAGPADVGQAGRARFRRHPIMASAPRASPTGPSLRVPDAAKPKERHR